MALVKLEDFYPNYRETLGDEDVKGLDVYTQGDDKVGSVDDVLIDERDGRFRYLVVDTGFWVFGKKVLLPIGLARIEYGDRRVYVDGLSKEQVENLPEFNGDLKIDQDYEEQVRGVYRPMTTGTATAPAAGANTASAGNFRYDRDSYTYDQEPSLYNMNEQNHKTLRLYEERLIANKQRHKAGEVNVGKHVETETARVSVPVEKERVVIERSNPTDMGTPVAPGEGAFSEGQVAHMDIYEETADVHKEAFVREQVDIHKEVEHETVNAEEQIRREELDLNADGQEIVDRSGRTSPDRR